MNDWKCVVSKTTNDWKCVVSKTTIEACRDGWPGAYDAIKSAITGSKRMTVPVTLTLSAWVKSENNIASLQLEVGREK